MKKEISKSLKSLASVLFPLSMILAGYIVPGTGSTPLGLALLLALSVIILIKNDYKIDFSRNYIKYLMIFAVYLILDQFLVSAIFPYYNFDTMLKSLISNLSCIFIILILSNNISYTVMYKAYSIIGAICCIGVVIQAVNVFIFNKMTHMIVIPGLDSLVPKSYVEYIGHTYAQGRPSSFFTEPAGFSVFSAPLLIMHIMHKKYVQAIIVSACILLTTSTTGLFLVIAIWSYWVFISSEKTKNKFLSVVLFVLGCVFVFNSDIFTATIRKAQSVDFGSNERTASAFYILKQMPFYDIITGVGAGNVANYLRYTNSINLSNVDVTVDGFITSGFGNFIIYGALGGIIYFAMCFSMLKNSKSYNRLISLLMIILSFIQTMSFNIQGVLWMVMYENMCRYEKLESNSEPQNKAQ